MTESKKDRKQTTAKVMKIKEKIDEQKKIGNMLEPSSFTIKQPTLVPPKGRLYCDIIVKYPEAIAGKIKPLKPLPIISPQDQKPRLIVVAIAKSIQNDPEWDIEIGDELLPMIIVEHGKKKGEITFRPSDLPIVYDDITKQYLTVFHESEIFGCRRNRNYGQDITFVTIKTEKE